MYDDPSQPASRVVHFLRAVRPYSSYKTPISDKRYRPEGGKCGVDFQPQVSGCRPRRKGVAGGNEKMYFGWEVPP